MIAAGRIDYLQDRIMRFDDQEAYRIVYQPVWQFVSFCAEFC